jgi:putative tricarboxylic transport membrane protein
MREQDWARPAKFVMDKRVIRPAFPYFVGLAVAAVLFFYTRQIEYTPRAGALGPDFWPRMAIGLMAAACLFEIGRVLLGLKTEAHGVADAIEKEDEEEPAKTYPWLLLGGIVLVTIYAFVVDSLGFLLSTFLFLSAFMYLGRYRRHVMVWSVSAIITLLAALLFMRFAYVSLPRGVPPFDAFTDFIRIMLGG